MCETTTVDVEKTIDPNGFQRFTITTNKSNNTYTIQKTNNGYSSYHIKAASGAVPTSLSGNYTLPDYALKALIKHLKLAKKSSAVRRDEYQEERKKRNASKSISNSKDTVQQGTPD